MRSKYRSISVALCAVILAISVGHSASAHVLKVDGTIGAILHINPDDSPVSGSLTSYSVSFKDTQSKLNLTDCGCHAEVIQNGTTLSISTLRVVDAFDATGVYTFPSPGVYDLLLIGSPNKGSDFQSFKLTYLIRVLPPSGSGSTQPFPLTLGIGLGLMIVLLLIASYKVV
jgi:hypothetical protein